MEGFGECIITWKKPFFKHGLVYYKTKEAYERAEAGIKNFINNLKQARVKGAVENKNLANNQREIGDSIGSTAQKSV